MEHHSDEKLDPHLGRFEKLRTHIAENDLEGIILVPGPNLRYLTGVNSLFLERPFLFLRREMVSRNFWRQNLNRALTSELHSRSRCMPGMTQKDQPMHSKHSPVKLRCRVDGVWRGESHSDSSTKS